MRISPTAVMSVMAIRSFFRSVVFYIIMCHGGFVKWRQRGDISPGMP
jgi:hypothetical protein